MATSNDGKVSDTTRAETIKSESGVTTYRVHLSASDKQSLTVKDVTSAQVKELERRGKSV